MWGVLIHERLLQGSCGAGDEEINLSVHYVVVVAHIWAGNGFGWVDVRALQNESMVGCVSVGCCCGSGGSSRCLLVGGCDKDCRRDQKTG